MADNETKEIQVKPKHEVTGAAEQTKPGSVFVPDVDIYESETEITLLAELPGVTSEKLDIDLKEDVLTLSGEAAPTPKDPAEQDLLIEYESGKYYRQFTLSNVIDQERITANLEDGVLTLKLPKVEKATPRKIQIQSN